MSKIQEMQEAINQLKECATALTETANFLAETFNSSEETPVVAPPKEKALTLEDVRGVLANKSRGGKTTEVKALITSFGADKLSSVNPSDYAELLKKAEVL